MSIKSMISAEVLKIRIKYFLNKLRKINSMNLPIVNIVPRCEQIKTGKHTTVINKNDYVRELLIKTSPSVLNSISSENSFDMHHLAKQIFLFDDDFDFNERCEFDLSNFYLCGDMLIHNQLFINSIINDLIWAEQSHERHSKNGKYISIANVPNQFLENERFAALYKEIECNHENILNEPAINFDKIQKFNE